MTVRRRLGGWSERESGRGARRAELSELLTDLCWAKLSGCLTSTLVPTERCEWWSARPRQRGGSTCLSADRPWLFDCSAPPRSPVRPQWNPAQTTWSSGSGPVPRAPTRRTGSGRTTGSPACGNSRWTATNRSPRPRKRPALPGWSTGSPARGAPPAVAAPHLPSSPSPSPGGNAGRRSGSPSSTTRCCSSGRCGMSCRPDCRPLPSPPPRPGCAAGRNRWRPRDHRISLPSFPLMFPPPPASGVRDDTSLTPVLHPKCWSHLKAGCQRVAVARSVPGLRTGGATDAAHLVSLSPHLPLQTCPHLLTTT